MGQLDQEALKRLASKYIWWKTPDEAVAMPERVVAQVMNIGDYNDVQVLAHQVGDEYLRDVLNHAEIGQFSERSWAYWHYRLGLATPGRVPPLPARNHQVKVSFFGTIGFGRIGEPDFADDGTLQVATLDDLMATKVKVILQRIEAKDYRDIAALVKAGVSLPKGLAAAREMYGNTFQPSESLKAMVYFEGGDLHTLTQNEKETLIAAASAVRDLPHVEIVSRELALAPDASEPSADEDSLNRFRP